MSAKKATTDGGTAVASKRTAARHGRHMLIVAGMLAALVAGTAYAIWHHVRTHVLAGTQYQVQPEQIVITPLPAWIKGDIKAEVLRDLSRSGPLSLLDDDLTVRLAGAFSAHPWIARVDRISKRFPSGVDVIVAYRTPVAMVEVQEGQALLPIDVQAVVLPTREASGAQNFTAEEAERYPRIGEIHTMPAGPVGTRWGDAAVLGAAQIAAAVAHDWEALKFARIIPWERKPAQSGVEYTYALVTHSGSMVFWGRAPGTETGGETPPDQKLAQLRRYAAQNGGTLDAADGPQQIEIGAGGGLFKKAKPVVTPLPPREKTAEQRTSRDESPQQPAEEPID